MSNILDIEVNWVKSIPFIFDAIIEIGFGIILLVFGTDLTTVLLAGLFLITFGIVQLTRKIKTFHLSNTRLLVKRPLIPLKFAEVSFELQSIKKIELKRAILIGPYLKVIGKLNGKDGGFAMALDKKGIDLLEKEFKNLSIEVSRKNV